MTWRGARSRWSTLPTIFLSTGEKVDEEKWVRIERRLGDGIGIGMPGSGYALCLRVRRTSVLDLEIYRCLRKRCWTENGDTDGRQVTEQVPMVCK